jgi:DNA-binding FadR family transcriptional regulator
LAVDGASGEKMASGVARAIEADVAARGWPVGEVLGSEEELIAKYGVSRAVFREAVRLVEGHHVAEMRRGPGGGLVVRRPDASGVIRSAALFLDSREVSGDQLYEARVAVELIAVQLAAERIDEEGIARLREALAAERESVDVVEHAKAHPGLDVHDVIAKIAGNPAIELFVDTLTELTIAHTRTAYRQLSQARRREANREGLEQHRKIVEAIISRDPAVARHRMLEHFESVRGQIS